MYSIEQMLRICTNNNKGVCFLQGADWQIESGLPYTAAIHDRSEPEIVEIMWASSISYSHALGKACEAVGLVPLGSFQPGGKWFSQLYADCREFPCNSVFFFQKDRGGSR